MKQTLTAALFILLLASEALCQSTYQWHTFFGAVPGNSFGADRAYAITFDGEGNAYTTGMSENTWNGPEGQSPLNGHSAVTNLFVLKLNASGAYQWHSFFGGSYCYGFDITSDGAGNLYVTGFSYSTWNGPAAQPPIHAFSGGSSDFFVLKLNSDGLYQWHTFFGSGILDEGSGIICDASNNVYVSGFSAGSWNGPSGQTPQNSYSGGRDIFVLKLDSAGAYQWHTFFGTAVDDDESFIIAVDAGGNLLVGGYSNATWNGPEAQIPIHPHSGGREIVVLKLDSDGLYQWHTFYGSSASDEVRGIRTDRGGNVYACGNSSDTWQGDDAADPLHAYSGSADHMILKLTASGAYLWHTFYGSAGANDYANGLALDANNDIYVAGRSYDAWQGDGDAAALHAYSGYRDISIFKLAANGAYRWHTFYGANEGDDRGRDIGIHSTSLYVVGGSTASWTGDDPGGEPLNDFAGGSRDAYVLKLNIPVEAATNVPTLTEWGSILLMAVLVISAAGALRRKSNGRLR